VRVDTDLEGAKIEIVEAKSPGRVHVAVPPDRDHPRFRQWFHFGLRGVKGARVAVTIDNAGACTWAKAFAGYDVCASYDGLAWFRVPTKVKPDGAVSFSLESKRDGVRFAYFAPWTSDRLAAQVLRARRSRRGEVRILGQTPLGSPFPMLRFGRLDGGGKSVFVVAQQHPGEHQAGWFVEGFVDRLLRNDRVARAVLADATVSLVPRMNPDGVALGNHRTNAADLDLNRQWQSPEAGAPEVAWVREEMARRGVDLFLDVHGDEMIPHVFLQGADGIPKRTPRLAALEKGFVAAVLAATPDFQTTHGYGVDPPGKANLAIGTNWVAETYDCLSFTLEMPFKDHLDRPDPKRGWSPERSKALGGAFVEAISVTLASLR
jgi:murein tripeptide amidase MpaA